MKNIIFPLTLIALLSCGADGGTKTVIGDRYQVQVEAPVMWNTKGDYNQNASINLADFMGNAFLIVIVEEHWEAGFPTLEEFADTVMENFLGIFYGPSVSEPTRIEVQGGQGIQYFIKARRTGVPMAYLHTSVETEQYMIQVIGWTQQSSYQEFEGIFQEITQSIQEYDSEDES